MIDIESLGTSKDAIIVSVGAVKFRLNGTILDEKYWELGLGEQQRRGRTIDSSTIQWWSMQSPEALKAIASMTRIPICEFIKEFNHFIQEKGYYSAKGTNFDLELITNLYERYDQRPPFRYSKWFDCRVIYTLAKELNIFTNDRPDIPHNALEDAKYQTKVVCDFYQKVKRGLDATPK